MLIEELNGVARQNTLLDGISRREVFAIDWVLGETARLEYVLRERQVLRQE